MIGKQKSDRHANVGAKIHPDYADVLNAIAESKGMTVYEMIQMVCQFLVRSTSAQHNMSEEMARLLTMFHNEHGWHNSFNLLNPTAKTHIAQEVLILEQEGKKGFGAVMVSKPYMGDYQQTECVDDIVERVIEVCMPGVYKRLRHLAIITDCQSISQLLITLSDSQEIVALEDANRKEMEQAADYIDYQGHKPMQGAKTPYKRKHRKGIDSYDRQQTIRFKPDDLPDTDEL